MRDIDLKERNRTYRHGRIQRLGPVIIVEIVAVCGDLILERSVNFKRQLLPASARSSSSTVRHVVGCCLVMCVRRLWVVEADLMWLLKLNNFGLAIGSETALVASVNLNRPHLMRTRRCRQCTTTWSVTVNHGRKQKRRESIGDL